MLILKTSQLKLQEDGQITFQPDATNPMLGEIVARVVKGADALSPEFEAVNMPEVLSLEDIKKWWPQYLAETVEDLVKLDQGEDITGSALEIAQKLKAALGVVPRGDIEDLIGQLDEESRRALRSRKVKLGPILVFLYTLNKPAAVRLRALLWSLYNDEPLPAKVPADGIVSVTIPEGEAVNHDFYRAISYPVYANRTVRIDMLDRVINLIYDTAEKGKFNARHEMAEWLGCSIPDLYAVLEAMGHKKIHDPAEEAAKEEEAKAEEGVTAEAPVAAEMPAEVKEETAEAPKEEAKPAEEGATEEKKEEKKQQEKPVLATFLLKKGKALAASAPYKKQAHGGGKPSEFKGKGKKERGKKGKSHKGKRDHNKHDHFSEPRVYSAPANEKSNSPFDVLKQLKADKDGS